MNCLGRTYRAHGVPRGVAGSFAENRRRFELCVTNRGHVIKGFFFDNNTRSFGYEQLVVCRHFIGHAFVIFTICVGKSTEPIRYQTGGHETRLAAEVEHTYNISNKDALTYADSAA